MFNISRAKNLLLNISSLKLSIICTVRESKDKKKHCKDKNQMSWMHVKKKKVVEVSERK